MTVNAARQMFGRLMKKARESHLTQKELAQLRTASQIIRFEKRRGFSNPKNISRRKARLILHEGQVRGLPLTERQRRFFGARASGYPRNPRRRSKQRRIVKTVSRTVTTSNPRRGLLRMGKLVELRYYRDHGKKPGYYKHVFDGSPTVYYDAARNMIIAR